MTPYLFPLDSAICGGHIIILGFIRKINSKYELGLNLNPLEYSQDVVLENCCRLLFLQAPQGHFYWLWNNAFTITPYTIADLQDSHLSYSVCVCVDGCASVTEPPSLHGGTVSKHAEYRLESNANQLLSYAAPDLWWTLGRWMLPRLSIEISGLEEKEHISYGFPAPASYLEWISKQAGWQRMHSGPHEVFNVIV